jgi:hypothetical protein
MVSNGHTANMTAPDPAATTWAIAHISRVTGSAASTNPQKPAMANTTRAWARSHRRPVAVTI